MARGFVVHPTYRVRGGVPVVQLYGRLETGEPFLVEDDRFRPYFFASRGSEAALAGEPDVRVEPCELRDLAGRPLVRVETNVPAAVPRLRERLERAGHPALEADAVRCAAVPTPCPTQGNVLYGVKQGLDVRLEYPGAPSSAWRINRDLTKQTIGQTDLFDPVVAFYVDPGAVPLSDPFFYYLRGLCNGVPGP